MQVKIETPSKEPIMPLTTDDLADIEKMLGRIEKNAEPWQFTRWVLLLFGILFVGLACWSFTIAQTFWTQEIPKEHVTGTDLYWERNNTMMFCACYMNSILSGVLGFSALCCSIPNWSKGKRDGLLVKLARSYVEEQRQKIDSAKDQPEADHTP